MKIKFTDLILAIFFFLVIACLLPLKHIYPENQFVISYLSGWPQFFIIIGFVVLLYLIDRLMKKKKEE
jgi:hypothetical protein